MTAHRLHRQQGVRPMPNLRLITGDKEAAYRDDTPQPVRQADNLRRFHAANPRLDGPPRHVRIEPRIDWSAVLAWWALALSLGCIVYFGAQLLRAIL